jgi:hypothetical protein
MTIHQVNRGAGSPNSSLFALAQFGYYLEVFEGGGVAFDFAVGGLPSKGLFHMRIALEARG